MKVVIRVDASAAIGSGHVIRCLTLADVLRKRGAQVAFICRSAPGDLCEIVATAGYRIDRLPARTALESELDWQEDAARTRAVIEDGYPLELLIVDHYALDRRWESALRPYTKRIMVIDDLADRAHDCDVLLDQNYAADRHGRYDTLVPRSCIKLLGPRFALLRPEFKIVRPHDPRDVAAVRRVFVFLSTADPTNVTGLVLDALDTVAGTDVEVDIVVGATSKHLDALAAYCAGRPGRRLHVQTTHVAELMAAADVAIGGGGVASWERACLGVPSLVIGLAHNQLAIAEEMARDGAHLYLGPVEELDDGALRGALTVLLGNRYLRTALGRAAFGIADGGGADRVARHLLRSEVGFRSATSDDCDRIFAWRNHPDTRRYFFDSAPIDLAAHRRWFAETIVDATRALLIGSVEGGDVGVVRYDFDGEEAYVSIYLDPARRGEGYGTALLVAGTDWLKSHRPGLRTVVAEVLPANEVSMRAFLTAGYRECHRRLRLDIVKANEPN